MKKAIKRLLKRIFILILVVFAIYLVITNIALIRDLAEKEKINVIIDADAANGNDDLFSILRIITAPDVELLGLLSAQWRLADLDNDSSVRSNQSLHSFILEQFNLARVPYPAGAPLPLVHSKGKTSNDAAALIIKKAFEVPYGQKLNMICMGSATNLATAILDQPDLSEKVICYIQGPRYDPSRRTWNKNDPVTQLDLEAMDILLNEIDLELYLLPANVASEMHMLKSAEIGELSEKDSLLYFIKTRWLAAGAEGDSLSLSSLALVEAFMNPDMSTLKQLIGPPENTQRKIYVYTRIDVPRMKKDFWKTIKKHYERIYR